MSDALALCSVYLACCLALAWYVAMSPDPWSPEDEGGDGDEWQADATGDPGERTRRFWGDRIPFWMSGGDRGPTTIINGCPRCGGVVLLRRRDGAKWCRHCSRIFFPMSDDSVIRYDPRWHRPAA